MSRYNALVPDIHAYVYHDPDTKVPFYVGIGTYDRCFQFTWRNRAVNAKLNRLVKQGKTPIIGIWILENWELACKFEQELIAKYGRKDLKTGTLYNLSYGGEGTLGHVHSVETKLKMSLAHIGRPKSAETRVKMSKPKSPETKAKMKAFQQKAKVNKGRTFGPEVRLKMSASHKARFARKLQQGVSL